MLGELIIIRSPFFFFFYEKNFLSRKIYIVVELRRYNIFIQF